MVTNKLSQNHLCKLSDKSTTGPHTKRHKLAESPIATILAVNATGTPFFESKKGNATVTKP